MLVQMQRGGKAIWSIAEGLASRRSRVRRKQVAEGKIKVLGFKANLCSVFGQMASWRPAGRFFFPGGMGEKKVGEGEAAGR